MFQMRLVQQGQATAKVDTRNADGLLTGQVVDRGLSIGLLSGIHFYWYSSA